MRRGCAPAALPAYQHRAGVPGERWRARTVVVADPAVFDVEMDRFPHIASDRLIVIGTPTTRGDNSDDARGDDIARRRANIVAAFGTDGAWVQADDWVRQVVETSAIRSAPQWPSAGNQPGGLASIGEPE